MKFLMRVGLVYVFLVMFGIQLLLAHSGKSQTLESIQVTIELRNENLKKLFRKIENQTGLMFAYQPQQVDVFKRITLPMKTRSVKATLDIALADTPLAYRQVNNNVIIFSEESISQIAESEKFPITITGNVRDAAGSPIPGVNILVKGTTNGTTTDVDGEYSLVVMEEDAVLVFSFIGYITQEVAVDARSVIDVVLVEDVQKLNEVVVVGYGTQKKSDLTGSVVSVSMEERESLANVNLFQALSGAAPGVNVQGSGLAGSEPDISIRGQTSLSASDRPLIVLDGIIYNGAIADINVGDVESIDILKDASAAAVFGSRSANGVMIITTKKGKTEKPVVSFNMYYGFQDMTNNPMKVMNAEQYAIRLVDYSYQQELYAWYKTKPTNATGKPVRPDVTDRAVVAARLRTQEERDNYMAGNEIDWVDEVTKVAPIQNYNLSVSGKSKRSNYFVSGSYTNEEGILLNDHFKRLTLRTNIESQVTDWFTLGLISSYSYRDYSGLEASLGDARQGSPLADNRIGSPNYDMFLTGEVYMPYPLNNLYVDNNDISNNLFFVGSGKITVPWIEGLTNEVNFSNTYFTRNNNTFYPVTTPEGAGNKGQAIKNPYEEKNWIVNNIVSYVRTFGDHQVNATLLYSRENRFAQGSTLTAQGFDNPVLGYNNMALGTVATVASSAWEENSLSYMARANYSFKNRYLLTGTVRRDGFSGFGANMKFATFPSVSLGWVASEEPFFSNLNWADFLKLRASYGKNGNQGIGRYSSFSRMASNAYVYGPETAIAVYPNSLGNSDLGWETTSSLNIGIDYGFLNGRISFSVDGYSAKTIDVLVRRAIPPTTGYQSVWANIGGIENKGIELQLRTVNLTGSLNWETSFVFSLNRDKISKLYGDESDKDIGNSWFVGESISAIYDYQMAGGLWTEEELYSDNILDNWYPGQFKYVDQNGDGVIEADGDRTIIGSRAPNYRFSIMNTLSYKNFSLFFLINSIQGGNDYYLENNASVVNVHFDTDNAYRINASAVRPYWRPDNGVNNATGIYNAAPVRSGIYESRSFVRLQDISLTYKFGETLLKRSKTEGLRIFVSGKNLYTWTRWSGWDPETGISNAPLMRNITTGLRITF